MKKMIFLLCALVMMASVVMSCGSGHEPGKHPGDGDTTPEYTLAGTDWILTAIVDVANNVSREPNPPYGSASIMYTLTFTDDGTICGMSGLNIIIGQYVADYDANALFLDVNPLEMMCCDWGDNELYYKIFVGTYATSSYHFKIYQKELHIFYNDGKEYLKFMQEPPCPLAGTSWKLIDVLIYKNNDQEEMINYSEKNITYEFHENYKLIVSDKTDNLFIFDNFKEGEHFYKYYKHNDCLDGCMLDISNNLTIDSDKKYTLYLYGDARMDISGNKFIGEDFYEWGKTFIKVK